MYKWAPQPHPKTLQCLHCGNYGAKKQSHQLYNHKTNTNPQIYTNLHHQKRKHSKNKNQSTKQNQKYKKQKHTKLKKASHIFTKQKLTTNKQTITKINKELPNETKQ